MKFIGSMAVSIALVAASRVPAIAEPGQIQQNEQKDQMLKLWTEGLGLSDEQAIKLKTALDESMALTRPLYDQRRQALKTLRDQIKEKAGDKDIQATLDQINAAQLSIESNRRKLAGRIAGFLRPTQRAKLQLGMGGSYALTAGL